MNGSGKNGSCCVLFNDNKSCPILDIKGEIVINKNLKCVYINNRIENLLLDVNCAIYFLMIICMMVREDDDIQEIHENLFIWYLRHEY